MSNLFLQHHGIKGQKWGVRRFQNSDGTLTPEGLRRYSSTKSAYKRGHLIKNDYQKTYNKKLESLQKASKSYQKKLNYKNDTEYRYDYHNNHGNRYSFTRRLEDNDKYMDAVFDLEKMDEQFDEKATKYAKEIIQNRYGKTAVSDIEKYDTANGIAAVTAMMAIYGGALVYHAKNKYDL